MNRVVFISILKFYFHVSPLERFRILIITKMCCVIPRRILDLSSTPTTRHFRVTMRFREGFWHSCLRNLLELHAWHVGRLINDTVAISCTLAKRTSFSRDSRKWFLDIRSKKKKRPCFFVIFRFFTFPSKNFNGYFFLLCFHRHIQKSIVYADSEIKFDFLSLNRKSILRSNRNRLDRTLPNW